MNVGINKSCYGCGVCSIVCPQHIIYIHQNEEGFYEPLIVDETKCTNCGLCSNVCSYNKDVLSLIPEISNAYGAWSNDFYVRRKCSSGGVAFEVGKELIGKGYKVCGVRYNAEKNRAEHYVSSTVKELIQSIGSKYIQSYTVDGFKAINREEKNMVVGTPCQIDSFRRYIRKFHCEDNFILMDFFCHGVPSMLMWGKYIHKIEKSTGKITYVSWRNKFTGWHDSWAMAIDGEEHGDKINWHDSYNMLIREKKSFYNCRLSIGDMFYRLFLGDLCLGKACYNKCKYKYDQSSADIRIGDLWGRTYENDEDGVSGVICFTHKGLDVLKSSNCHFEKQSIKVVGEVQLKRKIKYRRSYNKVIKVLMSSSTTIDDVYKVANPIIRNNHILCRLSHPIRSLRNIIKRFNK